MSEQQPEIVEVFEAQVLIPGDGHSRRPGTVIVGYRFNYESCRQIIEEHLRQNPERRYREIIHWPALKIGDQYYPVEEKDVPLIDLSTKSVPECGRVAVKFESANGERIHLINGHAVDVQ